MTDHVEQYVFVCGAHIVHPFLGYGERHPFQLEQIVEQLRLSDGAGRFGGSKAEKAKSA
jgi:hypothetical protein